jgi:hypothetical protein
MKRRERNGRQAWCLWGTALLFVLIALGGTSQGVSAQGQLTSPQEEFGFSIGDDYQLVNYTRYEAYLQKLARQSDRLSLVEMGRSAEGRPIWLAIVTSPRNQMRLPRYREIARRLALAEGVSESEARALAREGRAVVWIDGGLHATETLGAQQLIEQLWQMVSRTDEETLRLLDEVIMLGCLVNPDGMELVSDWYMREPDPTKRSYAQLPRLYQKYIGHDNNRDFYLAAQPESEAINRVFYQEWFPQIVYNHHQTGPSGTVLFAPPFRDPFNYRYDPLVMTGLDLVGAAMHHRFVAEGKPGATMRTGAGYSTWWNGGLRTTVYFHNMIGLLTETIGHPTPMEIPFVPTRYLPQGNLPAPIAPQKWHFRQSIEYSLTANRAVLDVAAKHREDFLLNIYRMGRNAIEAGSRDSWTPHPRRLAEVQAIIERDRRARGEGGEGDSFSLGGFARSAPSRYYEMLHRPEWRDPRGYVVPSNQPDFSTATRFINALLKAGVSVHRATADFSVGEKRYPAGSYVVKTAQAFRAHVLDMFEPQDHPNDFQTPGGPPIPPYDNAGWTLALQMGVHFDRHLEGFDGPFEKIIGMARMAPYRLQVPDGTVGFLIRHEINDAAIATNRLLAAGEEIYWLREAWRVGEQTYRQGTIYLPARAGTATRVTAIAADLGLPIEPVSSPPPGLGDQLRPVRIGLWDRYGGSMPSGWTRWILEQFEFPLTVVYPSRLDAGNLREQFDVLIFVTGAIPARESTAESSPARETVPAEYQDRLGSLTIARTVPQLKAFLEAGGTILTIGSSTSLSTHLGLPVTNPLVEQLADGTTRPLPRDKYYIPGSILEAAVDSTHPLAYGLESRVDLVFDNSPVFRLLPEAARAGIRPVIWFATSRPLRSGWAWGEHYLAGQVAVAEAPVGNGRLLLYGPEIAFRAQPHATFKLLFNGIFLGGIFVGQGGLDGHSRASSPAGPSRQ